MGRKKSGFFCLTNSPKPKDFLLTVINVKEKQHILTFKKLEPANVKNNKRLIKYKTKWQLELVQTIAYDCYHISQYFSASL